MRALEGVTRHYCAWETGSTGGDAGRNGRRGCCQRAAWTAAPSIRPPSRPGISFCPHVSARVRAWAAPILAAMSVSAVFLPDLFKCLLACARARVRALFPFLPLCPPTPLIADGHEAADQDNGRNDGGDSRQKPQCHVAGLSPLFDQTDLVRACSSLSGV